MSTQKQYTILVVEDDKYLADLYVTKLKIEGFLVEVANDGNTGVELAKKVIPDLVLLDLLLPGIDGFEVLKQLKDDDKTQNISVILLTNLNSPDDIKKGLELGAVDYMVKAHFVPAEIVNKVKNILQISSGGN
jgi:DNA-binding response OmpR family regulator